MPCLKACLNSPALRWPNLRTGVLWVMLRSLGKRYAPRREKGADAVMARSPVDVGKKVAADSKGCKSGALALGTPVEEIIDTSFQAAACTRGVSVSTPSRLKIAASRSRRLMMTAVCAGAFSRSLGTFDVVCLCNQRPIAAGYRAPCAALSFTYFPISNAVG